MLSNSKHNFFKAAIRTVATTLLFGFNIASANAQSNDLGKQLYQESCSACHGASGLGDGEFAQYLNVRPSNLTQLTMKQSDKKFPFLEVFMTVDGRTGVRGHGSTEMPIWGAAFQRNIGDTAGPYGAELLIRARLVALVDYIESMQKQ